MTSARRLIHHLKKLPAKWKIFYEQPMEVWTYQNDFKSWYNSHSALGMVPDSLLFGVCYVQSWHIKCRNATTMQLLAIWPASCGKTLKNLSLNFRFFCMHSEISRVHVHYLR